MTLQLNLAQAATIITLISTIAAGAWWLHKLIARFEKLEKEGKHRKDDSTVKLDALLATLNGLMQGGANGDVTKTHEKLKDYIINSR